MAEPHDLAAEVVEAAEAARNMEPLSLQQRREDKQRARRIEALTLRMAGATYEQIADRLGVGADGARDMVKRSMERAENLKVSEQRDLEGERLDRAQAAIWAKVLTGDTKAVDTFLRISQRRSRMFGLDAPTAINMHVDVRTEMENALTELQKVVLGEVVTGEPDNIAIEPDRD